MSEKAANVKSFQRAWITTAQDHIKIFQENL